MSFPFDAFLDTPFGDTLASADADVMRDVLGRDLYFNGQTQVTSKGDYKVVDGEENYRRGILRRLITSPGTYRLRPSYGAGVPDYVKKPLTKSVLDQLRQRIRDQVLADRRTEAVLYIELTPIVTNNRPGLHIRVGTQAFGRVLRSLSFNFSKEA